MPWSCWFDAVENARDLAEAAKQSEKPQDHVLALAKSVTDLCDALEMVADKMGIAFEEPSKDKADEQAARVKRTKDAAAAKRKRLQSGR